MFKRKVYDQLKDWKAKYDGTYAALIQGARRVGKSTVAELFAKAGITDPEPFRRPYGQHRRAGRGRRRHPVYPRRRFVHRDPGDPGLRRMSGVHRLIRPG